MKPIKAITLSLGELNEPVITNYRLGLVIFKLYRDKKYKTEEIKLLQKQNAEAMDFRKYLLQLTDDGVLNQLRGVSHSVYTLLGNDRWDPDQIMCSIDPFAYISYLSAMTYHGLTDRIPSKLFLSSPGPKDWKHYANQQMEKDLKEGYSDYMNSGLPRLTQIQTYKVGKTEISRFNSKHLGAYKNVRDHHIRVSTIGRTFLDMIRNPERCGGINHVLQTYDYHANKYLRLITDEVRVNGNSIDKVRVGYILNERLEIQDDVVESWVKYAQRGGSRKLDASAEYEPVWSDKWCLSLNVFE